MSILLSALTICEMCVFLRHCRAFGTSVLSLFCVSTFYCQILFCFVHHICSSLVPSLPDLTRVEKIRETGDEASANLQPQSIELVYTIIYHN